VTYWEVRSSRDLDIYRCVDVVDKAFTAVSQTCWSALALRPSGRGPAVRSGILTTCTTIS